MARIMKAGGGRVHSIDEEPRELTKELLVLTFGEEAKRDLNRRLASRRGKSRRRPSLHVRSMVRNLTRARPEAGMVDAWVNASPKRMRSLLDALGKTRLSAEGLQALCYLHNRRLIRSSFFPVLIWPEKHQRPPSRGLPEELLQGLAQAARSPR